MQITIFSVMPDLYDSWLQNGIVARCVSQNLVNIKVVNIQDYGIGNYKRVDDYTFGGGDSGMVMRPDVLSQCLESNIDFANYNDSNSSIILTSPRGALWHQRSAEQGASTIDNLYIITNRYEGIDQRIIDHYDIKEVSVGSYVLNGGELPSMVIAESIIRLKEGAIASFKEESFSHSLGGQLEYDHYTRPALWKGRGVPDDLTSGNHAQIAQWRHQSSCNITQKNNNKLFSF